MSGRDSGCSGTGRLASASVIGLASGAIAAVVELLLAGLHGALSGGTAQAILVALAIFAVYSTLGIALGMVCLLLHKALDASGLGHKVSALARRLLSFKPDPMAAALTLGGVAALGGSLLGTFYLVLFFSSGFVNKGLAALACTAALSVLWMVCLLTWPVWTWAAGRVFERIGTESSLSSPGAVLVGTALVATLMVSALALKERVVFDAVPKAWILGPSVLLVVHELLRRLHGGVDVSRRAAAIGTGTWLLVVSAAFVLVPRSQAALDAIHQGSPVAGAAARIVRPYMAVSGVQERIDSALPEKFVFSEPSNVKLPDEVPSGLSLVLISIDALRADHLKVYGYSRHTAPNLEKLAEESVVFDRYYTNCPTTRWAVPVMMTSKYPARIAWDTSVYPNPVKQENLCLAEVLSPAGLRTCAILGFFIFKRSWGISQGFEHYDNTASRLHPRAETLAFSSNVLTDKVLEYLSKVAGERFFIWVHYLDPHRSYVNHPEAPDFGSSNKDRYDKEIWFTDKHIGRLFEGLKELGLYDKTVIVVTADHGEAFGEHGFTDHGYTLHNEEVHVPLIIRVPGLGHERIETPASHVDLAPTLLNLLRVEIPSGEFEGNNLVPLILGRETGENGRVFMELYYGRKVPQRTWGVVDQRYKLIYDQTRNTWSLYDQFADPAERHNLVDELPGVAVKYASLLKGFMNASRHSDWERVKQESVLDSVPKAARPLGVILGGRLELKAASLAPVKVRPGGRVKLDLYFSALQEVRESYRVFVHVEGRNRQGKRCRFLADHLPAKGLVPTYKWKLGKVIRDEVVFSVPRRFAGCKFDVFAGLYGPDRNGPRLEASKGPAVDPYDRVLVGSFEVTE